MQVSLAKASEREVLNMRNEANSVVTETLQTIEALSVSCNQLLAACDLKNFTCFNFLIFWKSSFVLSSVVPWTDRSNRSIDDKARGFCTDWIILHCVAEMLSVKRDHEFQSWHRRCPYDLYVNKTRSPHYCVPSKLQMIKCLLAWHIDHVLKLFFLCYKYVDYTFSTLFP